jgi:hypothetical protein
MSVQEPRKPGRPSKPLKKGNSSWTPASLNEFTGKEPGYRYRMSRKDANNLSKKEQEGWENVSDLQSNNINQEDPNRIEHGKSLTSMHEGHDWILQRMPEELAQERDSYYNNEAARRVSGLTAHIKNEMKKTGLNAPVHGEITISSRSGTQVIE